MSALVVVLITTVGTIVVAAGGWVVTVLVRREQTRMEMHARSGTVRSSEAKDLWDEADKIREYLSERLVERDAEIIQLRAEVAECRSVCDLARQELQGCRERERALELRLAAAGL